MGKLLNTFIGQSGGGNGSIEPMDELPTPGAEWEGQYVNVNGVLYVCVKQKDGSYKWEKVGFIPVESNFLYSVIVDEANSDPNGAVTYTDDCEGFTPASKSTYGSWESFIKSFFKPCLLKTTNTIGQPLYYLNHDNRKYKEDGTIAIKDGTQGDCMIEVKSLWYNFENLDNNRYKLSISDSKRDIAWENFNSYTQNGKYKESNYIYLPCYVSPASSPMKSIVGSPTSVSKTTVNYWRTYASAKGTGYTNLDYRRVLLLQCMMLLLGKNRNTQSQFGGVWKNNMTVPGSLDAQKFISTDVFLGIEGLFDYNTSASGVYIDRISRLSNTQVKWTDDVNKFNQSGTDYENTITVPTPPTDNNTFISKVAHSNKGGFNPTTLGGSGTTSYCDGFPCVSVDYPHPYYFGVGNAGSSIFKTSGGFSIYSGGNFSTNVYSSGRICRLF